MIFLVVYFFPTFLLVSEETNESEKEELNNLLVGKLENLPHLPKSIVRIFLSSTFKGTFSDY